MANEKIHVRNLGDLPFSALVSAREIAAHVGTSETWVWRATSAGKLPQPSRLSARCTRWPAGPVRAALAAMGAEQQ